MHEGLTHAGVLTAFDGRVHRIDLAVLSGQHVLVYGQTEIQRDLAEAAVGRTAWEAEDVRVHEFETAHPRVTYGRDGAVHTVECDFIVGCGGHHGICRASIDRADICCAWSGLGRLAELRTKAQ